MLSSNLRRTSSFRRGRRRPDCGSPQSRSRWSSCCLRLPVVRPGLGLADRCFRSTTGSDGAAESVCSIGPLGSNGLADESAELLGRASRRRALAVQKHRRRTRDSVPAAESDIGIHCRGRLSGRHAGRKTNSIEAGVSCGFVANSPDNIVIVKDVLLFEDKVVQPPEMVFALLSGAGRGFGRPPCVAGLRVGNGGKSTACSFSRAEPRCGASARGVRNKDIENRRIRQW